MSAYSRYAIYYTAPGSELAKLGASWLGWDMAARREISPSKGPSEAVKRPRKYGFHATLKPPFHLAEGQKPDALLRAARQIAQEHAPFEVAPFRVAQLGAMIALTTDPSNALTGLAGACVTQLDVFRAPPSEDELARRRARGLTPAQEALLGLWGYPYVLDELRFHLTLTGPVKESGRAALMGAAEAHFSTALTTPHWFSAVTLCGERADGLFEALEVLPLRT